MIRKLKLKDKENSTKLYNGYVDYYKVPMNAKILDTVWIWIHDKNHVVNDICFDLESKIVGIAHYRAMSRALKDQYIRFLDDLFVETGFRGQKIAQKLIDHLKSLSKAIIGVEFVGATHSNNENKKKLCDSIAKNTGFELYELKND